MKNKKVVIIGSGLIGTALASFFAENNDVTVIDKASTSGQGCSKGNAGQVSASETGQWNRPDLIMSHVWSSFVYNPLISLLPKRFRSGSSSKLLDGFITDETRLSGLPLQDIIGVTRLVLASFFSDSSNTHRYRAKLAHRNLTLLAQILEQIKEVNPKHSSSWNKGLVRVFGEKDIPRIEKERTLYNEIGINTKMLTQDELTKLDPTLERLHELSPIGAGLFAENDGSIDPEAISEGMRTLAESYGAEFKFNTKFTGFVRNKDKVVAVSTNNGDIAADLLIIATGINLNNHAKMLGDSIPMIRLKGYSITVQDVPVLPRYTFADEEKRMACTPMGDKLRITGFVDVNPSAQREEECYLALEHYAEQLFKLDQPLSESSQVERWSEYRPCTPSFIPVIKRSKNINNAAYVGCAGNLGVTHGIAMAEKAYLMLTSRS